MAEGSFGAGEKIPGRDTQEVGMGRAGGAFVGKMVWRTATEGGKGERALDGGEIIEKPLPPPRHKTNGKTDKK